MASYSGTRKEDLRAEVDRRRQAGRTVDVADDASRDDLAAALRTDDQARERESGQQGGQQGGIRQVDATDVTVTEGDVEHGAGRPGDTGGRDTGTRGADDADTTPADEPGPTSARDAAPAAAAANEQVQAEMDEITDKGYFGTNPDPTPNDNYTLRGVVEGAPTPETDPDAYRAALDATTGDRVASKFPEAEQDPQRAADRAERERDRARAGEGDRTRTDDNR